jgi:ABC-2 type transport system ATP-binding protein
MVCVASGSDVGPAIETTGLTKRYGSSTALDALDLSVEVGEVFGFLGPNGAGKSTTISILLGLARASEGQARVFGSDPWADAAAVHRRTAYVPSEANLWPSLTAEETLRFLGRLHGSVDEDYRAELVRRFELPLDKRARALSHGNRQKVLLVAALAGRPDLLLLDEPTTGLDPLMEQVFRACVLEAHDRGQTVFLSSHILSEVEAVCDRVAMLRRGRLIETGHLGMLQRLGGVRVRAEFDGAPPDVSAVQGVTALEVGDRWVECDLAGPMQPLLHALDAAGVVRLATRERSLEEIFVAHYGDAPEAGPSP